MDIQLQELIDKIKKDGIESASEEASRLKAEAEAEAKRIVDAAGKEGEAIVARARAEGEKFEKAGVAALTQASRNLVLAFKAEIQSLLDKIVAQEAASAYSEDTLKAILPELVKTWAAKGSDSGHQDAINVILSEGDLKKLSGFFSEKLSQELKKGVELKSDRNLGAGFRIASKDGSAYYDFSSESVAELLAAYLNPRLGEILKTAVKG
jgi:V/A-type H+-transporting ATPase subunit E